MHKAQCPSLNHHGSSISMWKVNFSVVSSLNTFLITHIQTFFSAILQPMCILVSGCHLWPVIVCDCTCVHSSLGPLLGWGSCPGYPRLALSECTVKVWRISSMTYFLHEEAYYLQSFKIFSSIHWSVYWAPIVSLVLFRLLGIWQWMTKTKFPILGELTS